MRLNSFLRWRHTSRHCRRHDNVGWQGSQTADNKEYSSLRHYRIIVHYRLLQWKI